MVKLFAHRGYVTKGVLQNSIASLMQARKFGFDAVEFDIWFLEEKLILSHDQPDQMKIKYLPNLQDYFYFKNKMTYWMDFKNLNEKNCEEGIKLLKKEIDRSFVDLDRIYFVPYITKYETAKKVLEKARQILGEKINLVAVCDKIENEQDEKNLRDFLTENKIKFLSIFHKLINKNFLEKISDIEIFAWTVNDLNRLQELEQLGVKNFATDSILPKDLK
jgi:glycerophosphoryl diester phosphodiesterase